MKKNLLLLLAIATTGTSVMAQFSSGTAMLGSTGMTVKMDTSPTTVTLTLTGDTTSSFLGIGFGSVGMATGADGFIYNKASTSSTNLDYTFSGTIRPTADANQDWTVTSATGVGTSNTTIVATRSLAGSAEDTALANSAGSVDLFFAKGPSSTTTPLSYHGATNRGYTTLTLSSTLGTGELAAANKVTVYPNPSKGMVYLKNGEKLKSVTVYDASGRKLSVTMSQENSSVDLSGMKKGIYYLEMVSQDGKRSFEKMIRD